MTVEQVEQGPRQIARTVEVPASAEDIFALVADPHRHGELDGSGTVGGTVSGPRRLTQGAKFSVAMKQFGFPYRFTSTVTRIEDGRLVEWRHPAGHRWRWELTPLTPTSTRVTETFDYSTVPAVQGKVYELLGFPRQNAAGIEATLRQLASRSAGA
ncbi:SRPBCC family protein [Cryobacterium luteum]|uniref:Dimethyladenosine transferase n=1 Tax=Cryobacterium luteum TaxID=1424661 RepID=A0A1H8JLS4_9MICO|nr:SRPBCC family protein [Cryobacterium luteum]TFB83911.1 dimethyladenosine transferase [Cryobacterium luteum]SEN81690.1 YD repeat-containing protein [Cryobacterium luteum]